MEENNNLNSTPTNPTTKVNKKLITTLLIILVIVTIALFAIIFYRNNRTNVITDSRTQVSNSTFSKTDSYLDDISRISDTDSMDDIEKDITSTNIKTIDQDVNKIKSDLK